MIRVRTGVFWVAVCRYSYRGVGLVTTLVLAHLLSPNDFGLMAGAMIIVSILDLFYDFGISKELIYRRERIEEACHTAFTMNLALGTAMFLLACCIAPFLGTLLDIGNITWIVILAATSLPIASLGKVPAAIMQKEQRFKALSVPLTVASVVICIASISAALLGAGAYSLVVRPVLGSIVEVGLLFALCGYRPRLQYKPDLGREIFRYAKHLLGAGMIGALMKQIGPTVVARMFGQGVLGGFSLANRVATLPAKEFSTVLGRVLFPSIADRRDDPAAVRDLLIKSIKAIAIVGVPTTLAVAWFAQPALTFLYGSKWDHAVVFFWILPMAFLFRGLASPAGEVCKAVGQTKALLVCYMVECAVLALCVVPAAIVCGSAGVAVGIATASLLASAWLTRRAALISGASSAELSRALLGPCIAAGAAVVAALLVRIGLQGEGALVSMVMEALAGGCVFAVVAMILERDFVMSLLEMQRKRPPQSCEESVT